MSNIERSETSLIKCAYATMSRAIAELQYQLAELAGNGRLEPDANDELQGNWCFRHWEFLHNNTPAAVRNCDVDDVDSELHDNTYSTGLQIMCRVGVEPYETAEDHWKYNEHVAGDGPIQEYRRGAVYHIAEPTIGRR